MKTFHTWIFLCLAFCSLLKIDSPEYKIIDIAQDYYQCHVIGQWIKTIELLKSRILGKNLITYIGAVYTRENKLQLTLAVAYIRGKMNHLYECGLHKTRTAGINGSQLSRRPDQSNDDVVCFGASERAKKAKRLALVRKIAIFYTVVFFSN